MRLSFHKNVRFNRTPLYRIHIFSKYVPGKGDKYKEKSHSCEYRERVSEAAHRATCGEKLVRGRSDSAQYQLSISARSWRDPLKDIEEQAEYA